MLNRQIERMELVDYYSVKYVYFDMSIGGS